MEVLISNQISTLIYAIILGLIFGVAYDIIRICRIFLGIRYVNRFTEKLSQKNLKFIKNPANKEVKKGEKYQEVILFITDILYFLIITPIFAIFLYWKNDGIVRWYSVFGVSVGFLIYYFTIGRFIISISEYIVFTIKVIFLYLIFLITRPFVPLIDIIKRKIVTIKAKKREKKEKKSIKILKNQKRRIVYTFGKE